MDQMKDQNEEPICSLVYWRRSVRRSSGSSGSAVDTKGRIGAHKLASTYIHSIGNFPSRSGLRVAADVGI